jgi:DNA-binding HxlR family transcriptional regulator
MSEQHVRTEEFHVSGATLIAKIKELVQEGTVRRVVLKNEEGRTLVEFPLTLGVVGAVLAPQLAAIGAIAALVTRCIVVVEKVEQQVRPGLVGVHEGGNHV